MAGDELSQGKAKRNFGQNASMASLVAVILAWIIGAAYSGPPRSDTLEMGKYYAELLRIAVYVGGIICATLALFSIRKYGTKGILLAALVGLSWNAGYFLMGGHKRLPILRAYARGVNEGGIDKGIASARVAAASTKEVIAYGVIDFQRLDQHASAALAAVETASDVDALVLRGWGESLQQITAMRRRAAEAERKLIAANVLEVANIQSAEEFARRRWLANDWATAVHEAAVQLQLLPTIYRRQLTELGVSSARSGLEADRIVANLPRQSLEAALALHVAEQGVATRFNLAISALEDEWKAARDRAASPSRPDSSSAKQTLDALAAAQNTLKRQRENLGLSDPWSKP
jgi:hypothetical protein